MTPTQKARVKKWVQALRSGRYKQGREYLKTEDGRYCCLGVACEVYRKANPSAKWVKNEGAPGFMGAHETSVLPRKVAQWFGLDIDPEIDRGGAYTITGTQANDDKRWSFKKIATAVEKMYLKGGKGK